MKITKHISISAAKNGKSPSLKFLIISTSNHPNANAFIGRALSTRVKFNVKEILENPQDLINEFNTFYDERKSSILDILYQKGLSNDIGLMVLSTSNFRFETISEFVNE
jgi:hypothetical protein